MDAGIMAILSSIGGRLVNYGFSLLTAPRHNPTQTRIQHLDQLIQAIPDGELTDTPPGVPESPKGALLPAVEMSGNISQEKSVVATACVACAVGHFSTSSGLLKEALRFKGEGITSQEILDRIAGALEEQNALEREDLTQEKIRHLPEWERQIAEEALAQSRQLRHKLETIQSIEELEELAADTRVYYLKLSRQWYRGRFGHLGAAKADAIAQRVGGA